MGATSELISARSESGVERALIGVSPSGAREARSRLFTALEEAYPVCFEGRDDGDWNGYDAVFVLGAQGTRPRLPRGVACLWAIDEEERVGDGRTAWMELADSPWLARPLRSARLSERFSGGPVDVAAIGAHHVLATIDGAPIWVAATQEPLEGVAPQFVSVAPAELELGESLRERLAPGRSLGLLALVNFIQGLSGAHRKAAPPLSAAFILDDPNLHWRSYGYLRYDQLATHASEHGYHMVIAMAPIDGRFAHPSAVRTFKEHPAHLSICVHGNDHLGPELGRIATDREGLVLARQALGRAAAFQRRTGIPFERVMVPPHEQLSESAARGLLAGGFDGVCVSRPYPWIAPQRSGPVAALGTGPTQLGALAGWSSRETVVGGLPLILRTGFNAPDEDLVLRAFLGQPLVVYGHHDVLKYGFDVLAEVTASIERLGEVQWGSLAQIVGVGTIPARMGLPEPFDEPRPHLRPFLRRIASEARDRARLS